MRAMVLEEYGKPLKLKELDVPKPKPHEAVIRVKACGMCGTDLKIAAGKIPNTRIPVTMGHEPAGQVVEVGSEVTSLKPGDRVLAHFYVTCGRCEWCRTNRESICRNLIGRVGFEVDGGYADYLKLPETSFIKVPDSVSYEEAAVMGDAVGTAFHALNNRGHLIPGQLVLVMGVGGVGLHVVQVAKAFNARVIGVGRDEAKLALAKKHGADHVVKYTEPTDEYVRNVKKLFDEGDYGAHIIVETVGTPASMEANLKLLRPGGRLVIVGYLPGTKYQVDPLWHLLEEVEILGSRASTKTEMQTVVKLVASGLVKPVITQHFELPQLNEAFEELRQNKILGRAVIVP